MSAEWKTDRFGTCNADLGHGMRLTVSYEGVERLPADEAKFNVYVFNRRLKGRSGTVEDGKERAERVARRWLAEMVAALGGDVGALTSADRDALKTAEGTR